MQNLEEEIFKSDAIDEKLRRVGSSSAVRIRSSRDKETEQKPLLSLTHSRNELAASVKGMAKKKKKHTTFSSLTREVILKRRTIVPELIKKYPTSLQQLLNI